MGKNVVKAGSLDYENVNRSKGQKELAFHGAIILRGI